MYMCARVISHRLNWCVREATMNTSSLLLYFTHFFWVWSVICESCHNSVNCSKGFDKFVSVFSASIISNKLSEYQEPNSC